MSTLVVYHRCGGKSLGYPPNTLFTAKWAMENGAKAIEYDVAVAKDGAGFQVCAIEPKLITDAGLDINNLEWSDVRAINTGNEAFGPQPVSTLEEMLAAVPEAKTAHQIQLKGTHPAGVPELVRRVQGLGRSIVTAFDINVIKEIKSAAPNVRVGWLVKPSQEEGGEAGVDLTAKLMREADSLSPYSEAEIESILKTAKEHSVHAVLLCGPRIQSSAVVETLHANGFEAGAWGVGTNLELARALMGFGLDRFTLDNPEQL